ncbi:MAG: ubiquinone biosynthesis regulatory protein kinase UbiB [Gammaproteobacteria bacterium]|nr:ubiquinone biosynthesis regulatory protein kinase UbiB [Gammaproteobacteria bacterium]
MMTPGQLMRVLVIQRILIRHGADELLFTTPLLRSLQFLLYLLPWNWFRNKRRPRAERIRAVIEDLGPIFVKFGQILSTRRDLLPDDIAEELAKLQDAVPPFAGATARRIVERSFQKPVAEIFAHFDETPLASASIAQVHAASVADGRDVIVKVVRPGIRRVIEHDLGLMYLVAGMAERYWPRGRELKPTGVVAEFEKTILDELDLLREAANASQLRRNFRDSDRIYVAEIHWELCRRDVMVMERISGIRIDDVGALTAAGVDLKQLAEDGVRIFFTQVFRDHFFHADMHPGNLFVRPGVGGRPAQYLPVDFGIMGSLSAVDQRYLAENFRAFLRRDYRRVAELHVESGWVPKDTRVDDFEFAIRTVCEPIFDRPLRRISFGQLLLRLFQTAQRFHMKILPQLLLLQKTLVNIEGIGRQLYPDLDLWAAAQPPLEQWMSERLGPRRMVRTVREEMPRWAARLPQLPAMLMQIVEKTRAGELELRTRSEQLEQLGGELRRGNGRLVLAVIACGCLIGATVLLGLGGHAPRMLGALPLGTWLLGGLALALVALAVRPD